MKRRQQAAKQQDSEEAPQELPKGMVAMNVLLVLGHPRKNSLGGALYEALVHLPGPSSVLMKGFTTWLCISWCLMPCCCHGD